MVSIDEYADRAARQYSSYFPNHFVLIHSFLAFIFCEFELIAYSKLDMIIVFCSKMLSIACVKSIEHGEI